MGTSEIGLAVFVFRAIKVRAKKLKNIGINIPCCGSVHGDRRPGICRKDA